ncbi:hypothetical protein NIES2101_05165 [Calothrix sp. HK-06]|nr:hypothetical protein NIES2101_05165 [Calothrix sp. HK-06]
MPTTFTALKEGSTGADVRKLQQNLTTLKYYTGTIDGVFGTNTKNAVVKFQQKKNLSADGVVGASTWKQISFLKTFDMSPEQIVLNGVFNLA